MVGDWTLRYYFVLAPGFRGLVSLWFIGVMAELEYLQFVFQLAASSVTRLLVLLRIYCIASAGAPLSQAPKPSFTYAHCDLICAKRWCAPK